MKAGTEHFPACTLIAFTNAGSAIPAAGHVVVNANIVNIRGRVGLGQTDLAASTGTGTVHTRGEFAFTKGTGYTLAIGQEVAWDGAKIVALTTAVIIAGGLYLGRMTRAAATGDVVAYAQLEPVDIPCFRKAHSATAAENTANAAVIDTGFGAAPTGPVIVQIATAAGVHRAAAGAITFLTGADLGKVSIVDAGLAEAEIIHLIAYA